MNEPIISPWLIYWAGRMDMIHHFCIVAGVLLTMGAGISSVLEVISFVWVGSVVSHQALVKAGWVFKTKKEAKAALPTIAKEMGVKYKL